MPNVLTIDVEDYFHATNLESAAPPRVWHSLAPRINYSLPKTIDLLAHYNTRATFFILGHIARRHPQLVKAVAAAGHEVASHGYGHRLVYSQSARSFSCDIRKTKYLLEDLIGVEVIGYRAPNFSIGGQTRWAHDLLAAAGYRYDSSVHPIRHPRYGTPDGPAAPRIIETEHGRLGVLPVSVARFSFAGREWNLPIAGGAWWRLFPQWYLLPLLRRAAAAGPLVCYFHPWELDPEQPRFSGIPLSKRIRHYGGLAHFDEKIGGFLQRFSFVPARNVIQQLLGRVLSAPPL